MTLWLFFFFSVELGENLNHESSWEHREHSRKGRVLPGSGQPSPHWWIEQFNFFETGAISVWVRLSDGLVNRKVEGFHLVKGKTQDMLWSQPQLTP